MVNVFRDITITATVTPCVDGRTAIVANFVKFNVATQALPTPTTVKCVSTYTVKESYLTTSGTTFDRVNYTATSTAITPDTAKYVTVIESVDLNIYADLTVVKYDVTIPVKVNTIATIKAPLEGTVVIKASKKTYSVTIDKTLNATITNSTETPIEATMIVAMNTTANAPYAANVDFTQNTVN